MQAGEGRDKDAKNIVKSHLILFCEKGAMLRIDAPRTVVRGNVLKGVVELGANEIKPARSMEIVLYNVLTYGKNKCNHSCWEMKKKFSMQEAHSLFELPFEFIISKNAPITYSGKHLSSKWKLALRVDIIGGPDNAKEAEVVVLR